MSATLQVLFLLLTIVLAYVFWVRPILKLRPGCSTFYAQSDSWFTAIRLRFAGLKALLTAAMGMAGSAVVAVNDAVVSSGIDWTPLTSKVPGWLWPVVTFLMFWLVSRFRKMTDERRARGEEH